jgi:hypothetical protein
LRCRRARVAARCGPAGQRCGGVACLVRCARGRVGRDVGEQDDRVDDRAPTPSRGGQAHPSRRRRFIPSFNAVNKQSPGRSVLITPGGRQTGLKGLDGAACIEASSGAGQSSNRSCKWRAAAAMTRHWGRFGRTGGDPLVSADRGDPLVVGAPEPMPVPPVPTVAGGARLCPLVAGRVRGVRGSEVSVAPGMS